MRGVLRTIVLALAVLAAGRAHPAEPAEGRWAVGWFTLVPVDFGTEEVTALPRGGLQLRHRPCPEWDIAVVSGYFRWNTRDMSRNESVRGEREPQIGIEVHRNRGRSIMAGLWLGRRLWRTGELALWGELGAMRSWQRSEWTSDVYNGSLSWSSRREAGGHQDWLNLGLRAGWRAGRHWRVEMRFGWFRRHRVGWVVEESHRADGSSSESRSRSHWTSWGTYGWTGEQSLSILYAF